MEGFLECDGFECEVCGKVELSDERLIFPATVPLGLRRDAVCVLCKGMGWLFLKAD